jgi:hypothetical protein
MGRLMSVKKTAFVIVRKDWFDLALHPLITGRDSNSERDAHMLIGPLDDLSDMHGVWLGPIESEALTRADGSSVTMRILIPWHVVIAVGIVDELVKLPAGFSADATTVLTIKN